MIMLGRQMLLLGSSELSVIVEDAAATALNDGAAVDMKIMIKCCALFLLSQPTTPIHSQLPLL